MSCHAAESAKASSLGAIRTTGPYLWWKARMLWTRRPRVALYTDGQRKAAQDLGPG
jgi:hypothetical protein